MKKIFIILAILLISSCASRKVIKTETVSESKSYVSQVDTTKQKTTSNTKISDTTSNEEIVIEAIDELKEMIVDGKKYQNVRIKKIKQQKGITTSIIKDSVVNQGKTINKKEEQTISTDTKDTTKSSSSWIWIVVIIAVVGIILFYADFKRHN